MLKRKRKETKATEAEKAREFVGFQIGEELYGIDIHAIREIDRMQPVTRLPRSLPFIEGVINLRGTVIPVIDMAKRFGVPPVEAGRRTRIIIVRISGRSVGLAVGGVTGVLQLKESSIDPAPPLAFPVDRRHVEAVGRIEEGLIILLDLDLLLSVEEMAQLQRHPLS